MPTVPAPPPAGRRAQAFTLWLRSAQFGQHGREAAALIRGLLDDNPFTTLQVVLEPAGQLTPGGAAGGRAAAAGRIDGRLPGEPDLSRQVLRPAAGR